MGKENKNVQVVVPNLAMPIKHQILSSKHSTSSTDQMLARSANCPSPDLEPNCKQVRWQKKKCSTLLPYGNLVQAMKQALKHLEVNISERSAAVESMALKAMIDLVESHNADLGVTKPSGYHKKTIGRCRQNCASSSG